MKVKISHLFVGLPLLVIVVLALLPGTGWLVRLQLGLPVSPRAEALLYGSLGIRDVEPEATQRFKKALQEAAQQHPNDYHIQLGWTLWTASQPYGSLKQLVPRFGDRPALYAHLLRFAVQAGVSPRRPEEALVGGRRSPAMPLPPLPPPPADLLREFDRFAQQGERLDADNAYFPMMRAMGLFAARRDREAVNALLRASKCTRWDDYTSDETMARIALLHAAFGKVPAIAEEVADTVVSFWHHGALRSMARMAVYMAEKAEHEERKEEGVQIHLALMRCGHLMRVHGSSLIANLVGMAIISMGASVPGGAPPPPDISPEERIKRTRQRFVQYLRNAGKEAEAQWAEREFRDMDAQRTLVRQATDVDRFLQRLSYNISSWALSLFLLQYVLSIVMLWAVYALLARTSLRQGVEPYFVLPVALLGIGMMLWLTKLPGVTAALLSAMQSLRDQQQTTAGWLSSALTQISQWIAEAPPTTVRLIQVLAVLTVTLLTAGILAIAALFRRREGEHPLVGGIRRHGLPLAGILLLLYALLAAYTAHTENSWKQELMLRIQHEGRFLMQQMERR